MGLDRVLHAQIQVERCTAELYLNGIPLVRIHPKRTAFESRAVEELIVPGKNRLELLVEPGSHPSVARTESRRLELGDAWAVARLVSFPDGVFTEPENGTLLGEVRFDRPPGLEGPRTVPQSLVAEVDLGAANGKWAWQDAPVLEPGEALTLEARAVLAELAAAYRTGSVTAIWALFEGPTKDMARAYPAFTEAMARSELETMTAHYMRIPDRVLPLEPEQHDFRVVGGGRLLECVDLDWQGSLRLRDPDDGSTMPVSQLLARIGGRLRVVR